MPLVHPAVARRRAPTWNQFKAAVRGVDRDSLLLEAARATARLAEDKAPEEMLKFGISPWTIADVARTALAWGGRQGRLASDQDLFRLCNMNSQLIDESLRTSDLRNVASNVEGSESDDLVARILARMFFEQFRGQHSILSGVSRSRLLFGSAAQHPPGFQPQVMVPGWFEDVTGGIPFDDYIESVLLVSVIAQTNNGRVPVDVFDTPPMSELADVVSLDAARRVLAEHLTTTVDSFKRVNRLWQNPLKDAEKKFAFNPLSRTPLVEGIATDLVAPWVQAIVAKALPPAIYFMPPDRLRKGFADDLGPVFQHYIGRQLELIAGPREVIPESRYRSGPSDIDSCDWFVDLPGVTVLIECKSRQPIESLRTGSEDWVRSIEDSIGKGIRQLNRTNRDIELVAAKSPPIDPSKPRVGMVVTLEPFYVSENWPIRQRLAKADIPVAVLSAEDLEYLVLLEANELSEALLDAIATCSDNELDLYSAHRSAAGRENSLLVGAWDSIRLLERIEEMRQSATTHE